jgi:hypothetical protein
MLAGRGIRDALHGVSIRPEMPRTGSFLNPVRGVLRRLRGGASPGPACRCRRVAPRPCDDQPPTRVFASHTRLGRLRRTASWPTIRPIWSGSPAYRHSITYVADSFTLPLSRHALPSSRRSARREAFAVEFGNEIRADFQCLAGASLCELGEEFAALRIACPHEFDRLTLDVGEFFGPALL